MDSNINGVVKTIYNDTGKCTFYVNENKKHRIRLEGNWTKVEIYKYADELWGEGLLFKDGKVA